MVLLVPGYYQNPNNNLVPNDYKGITCFLDIIKVNNDHQSLLDNISHPNNKYVCLNGGESSAHHDILFFLIEIAINTKTKLDRKKRARFQ